MLGEIDNQPHGSSLSDPCSRRPQRGGQVARLAVAAGAWIERMRFYVCTSERLRVWRLAIGDRGMGAGEGRIAMGDWRLAVGA